MIFSKEDKTKEEHSTIIKEVDNEPILEMYDWVNETYTIQKYLG